MERIRVFSKNEREANWEVTIFIGHESRGVGFMLIVDKEYWEKLTRGRHPPEDLARKSFEFLLRRGKSPFSIPRNFNIREIQSQFNEYEDEMRRRKSF